MWQVCRCFMSFLACTIQVHAPILLLVAQFVCWLVASSYPLAATAGQTAPLPGYCLASIRYYCSMHVFCLLRCQYRAAEHPWRVTSSGYDCLSSLTLLTTLFIMPSLGTPSYILNTNSATALANSLNALHGLRVLMLNADFKPADAILALTCLTQLQMLDVGIGWEQQEHLEAPARLAISHSHCQLAAQLQSCLPNCRILLLPTSADAGA